VAISVFQKVTRVTLHYLYYSSLHHYKMSPLTSTQACSPLRHLPTAHVTQSGPLDIDA